MTSPRSPIDSPAKRGSLTPVCIVVYLALHPIWSQIMVGPEIFVYLRVLFMIGISALLWSRGQGRDILAYFVGRISPQCGFAAFVVMLLMLVVIRIALIRWIGFTLLPLSLVWDNVTLAPVNEEMVFRGLFLSILLGQMTERPWLAILLGALVFCSVHNLYWGKYFSVALTLNLLLLGCMLGWIFFRTRSVLCCVLAHSLWNVFAFIPAVHHR